MSFVVPVLERMIGDGTWREVFVHLAQDSSKESFFLSQGLKTLVALGRRKVLLFFQHGRSL